MLGIYGAEGGTRTRTGVHPLPPQDSVSTKIPPLRHTHRQSLATSIFRRRRGRRALLSLPGRLLNGRRSQWNQRNCSLSLLWLTLDILLKHAAGGGNKPARDQQAVPQTTEEESNGKNCGELTEKRGCSSAPENSPHGTATASKSSRQTCSFSRL